MVSAKQYPTALAIAMMAKPLVEGSFHINWHEQRSFVTPRLSHNTAC